MAKRKKQKNKIFRIDDPKLRQTAIDIKNEIEKVQPVSLPQSYIEDTFELGEEEIIAPKTITNTIKRK
jgi:hypothetical protein